MVRAGMAGDNVGAHGRAGRARAGAERHQDHDRRRQVGSVPAGDRHPIQSRGQAIAPAASCPIAVPTHKLAAEARTKMPHGVTVAIWQGLKAIKLATNEPMCLNHAAVDAALALGADVETTACRRGQRGGPPIVCPF